MPRGVLPGTRACGWRATHDQTKTTHETTRGQAEAAPDREERPRGGVDVLRAVVGERGGEGEGLMIGWIALALWAVAVVAMWVKMNMESKR
jgi:hypothetical protein